MTKICKVCNKEFDLSCFRYKKQHNGKYYYEPYCKPCETEMQKARSKKRYQERGKEEFALLYSDPDAKQEWLQKNKEYRQAKKDELKAYRETRKEKDRENVRAWEKKRRAEDVVFKLRNRVSNSVKAAIKRQGKSKGGRSILEHLPYTIQELKTHLEAQFEPWMNWNNHGKYNLKTWDENDSSTWTWQIDHIIPQSDLPYDSMDNEGFRKCWALDNLRPLSAKQNLEDGTRRIRHKAA